MMSTDKEWNGPRLIVFSVLVLLAIRFVLLDAPALTDPSEGRFASISQHMLHEGEWLSPKIFDSQKGWIPYQAKPPFFMWLQAASMKVFGENAFAARFPAFIGIILTLLTLVLLAKNEKQSNSLLSSFFYLSLPLSLFIGTSGITDSLLVASTTWIEVSFIIWIKSHNPKWMTVASIAAAIGVLTKGPIALVLTLPPFLLLLILNKRSIFKEIHFLWGIATFLGVIIPVFILIENNSPGFLNYFFIHENVGRYLSHDFENHYGSVKETFFGCSLLFFILYTFPWTHTIKFKNSRKDLLIFAIWPAVFFALSKQVLVSYILPSAPWIALLLAEGKKVSKNSFFYLIPSIGICFLLIFGNDRLSEKFSGEKIILDIKKMGILSLGMEGFSGNSLIFYGLNNNIEFKSASDLSAKSGYILIAPHLLKSFAEKKTAENFEVVKIWPKAALIKKVSSTDPLIPKAQPPL